jgi:hypothetical protein
LTYPGKKIEFWNSSFSESLLFISLNMKYFTHFDFVSVCDINACHLGISCRLHQVIVPNIFTMGNVVIRNSSARSTRFLIQIFWTNSGSRLANSRKNNKRFCLPPAVFIRSASNLSEGSIM